MDHSSRVSAYRARRGGSDVVSTPHRANTPSRAGSFGRHTTNATNANGAATPLSGYDAYHGGANYSAVPSGGGGAASGGGLANANTAPSDLTTYILELEAQNRDLRQHIAALQGELSAAAEAHSASAAAAASEGRLRETVGEEGARALVGSINRSGSANGGAVGSGRTFSSEAEKKAFLTDILSQVEVVIQAHRNKTQSEISRYRAEAESARAALRGLREVIQNEGMDLTLAPGLMHAQRTLSLLGGNGNSGGGNVAGLLRGGAEELDLPPDCEALLGGISHEMLRRLVALEEEREEAALRSPYGGGGASAAATVAADDLPRLVKAEVRRGFTAIVRHFSDQLVMAANDSAAALADQRADNERMKAELRTQLHMSEERRLALVQAHDIEVGALRDELHAFNVAATDDDVERGLHQRALEEYNRMLVDSRMEAAALRKAVEEEKNHSAEVCLRLKTALQRRSAEFEKTIVTQAEALVKERDGTIGALRAEIADLRGPPKVYASFGCQAGESFVVPVDADNYVTNVLKAMRRDTRSVGEANAQYERDLWRHTQDLIHRYGGVLPTGVGGVAAGGGGAAGGAAAADNTRVSLANGGTSANVSSISRQSSAQPHPYQHNGKY